MVRRPGVPAPPRLVLRPCFEIPDYRKEHEFSNCRVSSSFWISKFCFFLNGTVTPSMLDLMSGVTNLLYGSKKYGVAITNNSLKSI